MGDMRPRTVADARSKPLLSDVDIRWTSPKGQLARDLQRLITPDVVTPPGSSQSFPTCGPIPRGEHRRDIHILDPNDAEGRFDGLFSTNNYAIDETI